MNYYYTKEDSLEYVFPTIMPRRDRTPRAGRNALKEVLNKISKKTDEHKILFLDSWNEWGEGSYMEPDIVFGHQYLEVLRNEILK